MNLLYKLKRAKRQGKKRTVAKIKKKLTGMFK